MSALMLAPRDMPRVPGFTTPEELYCVARDPAPLFGMPYPWRRPKEDWQALAAAGVHGVLCLAGARAGYDPAPVALMASLGLEDLVHGGAPADPAREIALIRQAVDRVLAHLHQGQGVVVHCLGGRGRTGTVLGAVLVRLGQEPSAVTEYLDELHRVRGGAGWPEAKWQGEVLWGAKAW